MLPVFHADNYIRSKHTYAQKQPPEVFLEIQKIHRKTPVPETLF